MSVSQVDPLVRLNALQEWMNRWIDSWPIKTESFHKYFKEKYSYLIPGTIDYAKAIATHCFYCDEKMANGRVEFGNPMRSSIDHYEPRARGKTERYVICCARCNTNKGSTSPEKLVSVIIRTTLIGKTMWGFHGEKLKHVADQIQKITNDMLYNMGPRIYYIKK